MTLTELSYYSRKALPFVILFVMVLLVFFYAVRLIFVYLSSQTTTTLYTNPAFGKIKAPFVKNASNSAGLNFTLDTIQGEPVTASAAAKVFLLPPTTTRFGYTEKIYLMAKTLGFDTTVIKHKLVDHEASFSDMRQKLTIDITNFNFHYEYAFDRDPTIFAGAIIPEKNQIQNKAIDFLKTLGRYPDELSQGKDSVNYMRFDPATKNLNLVSRPQEANVVEIDFFRPDIDGFASVTPGFPSSQNYVVMLFNNSAVGFKVLRAQIAFFEKSDAQVGVYPLKTGAVAWTQLKAGRGIVVSKQGDTKDVTIKTMFTAYFDPDTYQDYLQPVYVFVGEPNFVAYIPAVSDEFLTE